MFEDDFLLSLSEDPDEGLGQLYKALKNRISEEHDQALQSSSETAFDLESARRSLLNMVFAFVSANNLEIGVDQAVPPNSERFYSYFLSATEGVEFYIAKRAFERVAKAKSGTSAIYVLTLDLKDKIHRYLDKIRALIAGSSLTETKRAVLSKKLNAFADEVDRNRTRVEALAAAIIWTRKEMVEGAEGLEPIIEKLDKMFQSFAKATEFLRLPSSESPKQLPPPQKKIEGPKRDLDDEVPF